MPSEHPLRRSSLNYKQIATKTRVSYGYVRQIAAGIRTPSFEIAERLARACSNDAEERQEIAIAIMHFGKSRSTH